MTVTNGRAAQRHIAAVPERFLVLDAGGNNYRISDAEMEWFVDYFENGNAKVASL